MLLGKRILGEAGAASEAAKQQGGAVVAVRLGPRLLGQTVSKPTAPAAKAPTAQRARPVRASGNRTASPQVVVVPKDEPPQMEQEPAGAEAVGFTEGEVESMLATDANMWDVILDAESKRPEGPRVAVAALLLAATDRATDKPMPAVILAELERLTQPIE